MKTSIDKGNHYEKLAKRYLEQQGLLWQQSNYRTRLGEIDLIMQDKQQLVFVEVRFRRHSQYGSGADTITHQKQQRIIKAAQHFLQAQSNKAME